MSVPLLKLHDCTCGAKPGQVHVLGCDVERCSASGEQKISCGCADHDHDPAFARWTGMWPGEAEAMALGLYCEREGHRPVAPEDLDQADRPIPDLNRFLLNGLHKVFFIKPRPGGVESRAAAEKN